MYEDQFFCKNIIFTKILNLLGKNRQIVNQGAYYFRFFSQKLSGVSESDVGRRTLRRMHVGRRIFLKVFNKLTQTQTYDKLGYIFFAIFFGKDFGKSSEGC